MTYISGTLTDSNSPSALYALIAPALTTAGYTLVDTVVISTRTHKVWKSAAASNAQNLDWFLDVIYTTAGSGTLAFSAFEFYDPATDLGYRGPIYSSSPTIDATTGSMYGATGYALETNWASAAALGQTLPATSFGYWISITTDRVMWINSINPQQLWYAGFYLPDPLYSAKAGAKLYPLVSGLIGSLSNGQPGIYLTRLAPLTSIAWSYYYHVQNMFPRTIGYFPQLPGGSTVSYPFTALPVLLVPMASASGTAPAVWGQLRDTYGISTQGSVVRGDTCTIDGVTYILSSSNATSSYAMKAV